MVYTRLNAEPQKVSALASATGKHRNTVASALRTLARYGLATDSADGWVVGPRDAAEVARELSAPTAKSRRERGIASERQTFREVLALRYE
jgi:predicted transcriptional regulator